MIIESLIPSKIIISFCFRVAITSMEEVEKIVQPSYTFCPRWKNKELEKTKKPEEFITSTNL